MSRSVDLWLAEFDQDPHEVALTIPCVPKLIARKGDRIGRRQLPARRNLIVFRNEFAAQAAWDGVIDTLIASLGGWEATTALIERLKAQDILIQFNLPVRHSPHQENNAIGPAMLGRLVDCGVALGFEFCDYEAPMLQVGALG